MINQFNSRCVYDAVISGCGIVGMAAALVLASSGFKVLLLGQRVPQFQANERQRFDPRVFALSYRSQRLLEHLRVWQNIPVEKLQPVTEMQIWGDSLGNSQGYLRFNASDTGVEQLSWIVEQSTLFEVLFAAMRFQPSIDWLDSPLEGLSREADGWVVTTALNTFRQVPLVLAADGANSLTRQLAGLDFELVDYCAQGLVAHFVIEKPHRGIARQWMIGQSVLALLPLPGSCVSMVWSMPWAQAQALMQLGFAEQIEKIKEVSEGAAGLAYGHFEPVGEVLAFPLRNGVAPLWFNQGVVLMGDAAHVVHPLAGQGLNLGLEDVAELSTRLMSRKNGLTGQRFSLADEQFWRAWERHRKAACKPVHALTDGLHTLFRLDWPGVAWVRNKGMHFVNQLPMLKRWLCRQAMR
jgi:ubiquinone biosynthesis UbiH/UbiF/VisC/COQ6 family hydroxylase